MKNIKIIPLSKEKFKEAVDLVFNANLDTRVEIEHHLNHLDAHKIAVDSNNKIVGVIGWYQDDVNYANQAMGNKFPGIDAYWVGFFAVNKKFRNQGIGKSLLKSLEDELKQKQVKHLWVSSVPETRAYYEKQGFLPVMTGFISGNKKFFLQKNL